MEARDPGSQSDSVARRPEKEPVQSLDLKKWLAQKNHGDWVHCAQLGSISAHVQCTANGILRPTLALQGASHCEVLFIGRGLIKCH